MWGETAGMWDTKTLSLAATGEKEHRRKGLLDMVDTNEGRGIWSNGQEIRESENEIKKMR